MKTPSIVYLGVMALTKTYATGIDKGKANDIGRKNATYGNIIKPAINRRTN